MRIGDRWNQVLRRQEGENSSGAGGNLPAGESNPSTPGTVQGTELTPGGTNGGSQSPFTHPSLAGKTEAEIATLLTVHEAAVREQGIRLNQLERERQSGGNQNNGTQTVIPETPVSPTDYWADPMKFNQMEREKTISAVKDLMAEMIAPLRAEVAENKTEKVWGEARSRIPDFTTYEPLVRQLWERMGKPVPNFDLLETLYYTAFGYVQKNGGGQAPAGGNGGNSNNYRPAPPQHQPANQPIRQQTNTRPVRELTENERTIARMKGLTPEQYLADLENSTMEMS